MVSFSEEQSKIGIVENLLDIIIFDENSSVLDIIFKVCYFY